MTVRTLASAAAAATLAGVAVLGVSAPAVAQQYPPATGSTISDSTPVAGQSVTIGAGRGTFDAQSPVTVVIAAFGIRETVTADATGAAEFTFTVPSGARPGRVVAVFNGTLAGAAASASVAFTVVASAAAAPGRGQGVDRAGALPFTGTDDIVPLTITGVALIGVGAGIVVAARRRRDAGAPAGLA